MHMNKLAVSFILSLAAGTVFADRNINLEVDTVYTAQEQLPVNYLMQSGNSNTSWTNQAEVDAHLIVAPAMNIGSGDLAPDALIDVFITRETGTNAFVTALREAYVDLLFYNSLSLKAGFIRLDYGAINSWYNPLNIVELLNLQSVYRQIMIGNARQGYEGLPDIQAGYSFPELISDLKLSLEQDMICTSLSNFQDNFLISKVEAIYANFDLAFLMGYTPESWDATNSGRFLPVFGSSLSYRLPLEIMFFGEAVYKNQSFNPALSSYGYAGKAAYVTTQPATNGDFFDYTLKLSYTFKEPVFNNSVGTSLEYFHYAEGMTPAQYGNSYDFSTNGGYMFNYGFYRMDRTFQDYLYYTLNYTFIVPKISLIYALDAELESGYLQHTLTFMKSYDTVTIKASFVYNETSGKKYNLAFFNQDFALFLEALISI